VRVEYDPRRSPGRQLVSLTLADGSPLAEDRLYKVAVNDFMLAGGEGFKVLQKGVDPVTTADVVREVIVAAARQQQTIDWQDDGRLTPVQSQPVT
ncbi:MAG: 5'-nucleotidase C-terminal domain-containing protein, partial [Negativicutes bacterium]|nr:5'-nucleotidase C-terminal domain-containing protein [Negativicutes bacterium]